MLQSTKNFYGAKLEATDGTIGHVKDFYFDDKNWVIRYLVADTGSWLTGRLVLISPHAFGKLDLEKKIFPVGLRKKQIEDSPSPEAHRPVSRQYEIEYFRYYQLPAYWDGDGMWGLGAFPMPLPPPAVSASTGARYHHREDKHLQSTLAVTGFQVLARDGPVGKVKGFLVDNADWSIRYLVLEAGHWYAGKEILISPNQVDEISYPDLNVALKLTKAEIQRAKATELAHATAVAAAEGNLRKRIGQQAGKGHGSPKARRQEAKLATSARASHE